MGEPRIFMSHSHKDNDFGVRLAQDIRRALGDEDAVWYDADGGLTGGDAWWRKIMEEIEARPIFIVVLSPHAVGARWVNDEIDLAWKLKNDIDGRAIIPVMCGHCNPRLDLTMLQIIDFVPPNDYADKLEKTLDAIRHAAQSQGAARAYKGGADSQTLTNRAVKLRELVRRACQRNIEKVNAFLRHVEHEPPLEGTPDELDFGKRLRVSCATTPTWELRSLSEPDLVDALSIDEQDRLQKLYEILGRLDDLQRALRAKFDTPDAKSLVVSYESWTPVARGSARMYIPERSARLIRFNTDTRALFTEWAGLCEEVRQRGNPIDADNTAP